MIEQPRVSIILLLFRPGNFLKPCLASIFAQTYNNFELLIIDNYSGDNTLQELSDIIDQAQREGEKLPEHKIIANNKNLGFAAGQNLGIKTSQGELVLLLNQDVILDENYLTEAVKIFLTEDRVGAVQGKFLKLKIKGQTLVKSTIIDSAGLVIFKNRRVIARGQGEKDIGQYDETQEIFGADGPAPLYRREALEHIKIAIDGREEYFDEDFLAYKEDIDLAWRLRLYGWRARYQPRAVLWHARTAGESAALGYRAIIQERLKINRYAKLNSFKNQRLMQLKNEDWRLLFRHAFYFIPKEIGSWVYALIFERYTWKVVKELFILMPKMWRKRKIIMSRKRASAKDMQKWFQ